MNSPGEKLVLMETEENNSTEDLSVSSRSTVNENSESEGEENTVTTNGKTENLVKDEECLKPLDDSPANCNNG